MSSVTSTRASNKTRKQHDRVKKFHMFGPDEIDPYVRASIDKGATRQVKETEVAKDGGTDCDFSMLDNVLELEFPNTPYTDNEDNKLVVTISAWDKDYIGADDLIGSNTFNLMKYAKEGTKEKDIELPIKAKGKFVGIIIMKVEISYTNNKEPTATSIPSGKCKLTIERAEELVIEGSIVLDDEGSIGNFLVSVGVLGIFIAGYAAFFSLFEDWYFTNGMYFAVVTFSTVGYGDLSPDTDLGKIFVTCTGIFGVAVGGVCFNNILSYIITLYNRMRGCCKKMSDRKKRQKLKNKMSKVSPTDKSMKSIMIEDTMEKVDGKNNGTLLDNSMKKKVYDILGMLLILLCTLFVGTFAFMFLEGWNFIDSLYVSMITLLTIGYGDMSPETDYGRFFCLFFLVFGFTYVGRVLSSISETYVQIKTQKMRKRILQGKINKTAILNMDENGDGQLDRVEFLTNMIYILGMCEKSEINEIMKRYDDYEKSQKKK